MKVTKNEVNVWSFLCIFWWCVEHADWGCCKPKILFLWCWYQCCVGWKCTITLHNTVKWQQKRQVKVQLQSKQSISYFFPQFLHIRPHFSLWNWAQLLLNERKRLPGAPLIWLYLRFLFTPPLMCPFDTLNVITWCLHPPAFPNLLKVFWSIQYKKGNYPQVECSIIHFNFLKNLKKKASATENKRGVWDIGSVNNA